MIPFPYAIRFFDIDGFFYAILFTKHEIVTYIFTTFIFYTTTTNQVWSNKQELILYSAIILSIVHNIC